MSAAPIIPTRPALRYHGGKWLLAPWIISYFPAHRVYVEPFGGAASVLLRKPRSYAEIYNERDGEIVNLFHVYRDHGAELIRRLEATPFARDEYALSFAETDDAVEQARRTVIRSFMGFGSNALLREIKSGFRSNSNKSGTTPAHDWANYPDAMGALVARLRGIVIENRDALEVMRRHDGPATLHYVDPPYVHQTRKTVSSKQGGGAHGAHGYRFELTDDDHRALASTLHQLHGMVVLSGYACELYNLELYATWSRVEKASLADGARKRTEVLWMNDACAKALEAAS